MRKPIKDALKASQYAYRLGVLHASELCGDIMTTDEYLSSNLLHEPRKFRMISGPRYTELPLGPKGFNILFASVITDRLPDTGRNLCQGDLFHYCYIQKGGWSNEIKIMFCMEYARGLQAGKTVPLQDAIVFHDRFCETHQYGDYGKPNRSVWTYGISVAWALNDFESNIKQAREQNKNIKGRLSQFARRIMEATVEKN